MARALSFAILALLIKFCWTCKANMREDKVVDSNYGVKCSVSVVCWWYNGFNVDIPRGVDGVKPLMVQLFCMIGGKCIICKKTQVNTVSWVCAIFSTSGERLRWKTGIPVETQKIITTTIFIDNKYTFILSPEVKIK